MTARGGRRVSGEGQDAVSVVLVIVNPNVLAAGFVPSCRWAIAGKDRFHVSRSAARQ